MIAVRGRHHCFHKSLLHLIDLQKISTTNAHRNGLSTDENDLTTIALSLGADLKHRSVHCDIEIMIPNPHSKKKLLFTTTDFVL